MNSKILIDADFFGFHSKECADKHDAITRAKNKMTSIINRVVQAHNLNIEETDIELFFTSSANIRYDIDSKYKANRKETEKPKYLSDVKKYFKTNYQSHYDKQYEADVLIIEFGSEYHQNGHKTFVLSYDKDVIYQVKDATPIRLLKNEKVIETLPVNTTADRINNIARQIFTGDAVDNISPLIKGKSDKYFLDILNPYFEQQSNISTIHFVHRLCEMLDIDFYDRLRLIMLGSRERYDSLCQHLEKKYSNYYQEICEFDSVLVEVISSTKRTLSKGTKKKVPFNQLPIIKSKKSKYYNINLNTVNDYSYFAYLYSSKYATIEHKQYISTRMEEAPFYIYDEMNDNFVKVKGSLNSIVSFGKYKGKKYSEIDDKNYLKWIIDKGFNADIQQSAFNQLQYLIQNSL